MVIDPSTHDPDNRVQGLPSVGVEVLPQEVSQAFQLGRKAVLPAGKLQPPVPFARSTPVSGSTTGTSGPAEVDKKLLTRTVSLAHGVFQAFLPLAITAAELRIAQHHFTRQLLYSIHSNWRVPH